MEIRGRVGSLLEVGTGFHPELTGRENVYLNGAILGHAARRDRRGSSTRSWRSPRSEQFLDTPVKRYSSGMYVRLAFAVAAHLEPEILIVDEVLAVGDAAFQKKCLGKMGDVARRGPHGAVRQPQPGRRSFAVHARASFSRAARCSSTAPWTVPSRTTCRARRTAVSSDGQVSFGPDGLAFDDLALLSVRLRNEAGEVRALFDATEPITVEIEYEFTARLRGARTVITLSTPEGEVAFQSTDQHTRDAELPPGRYLSRVHDPGRVAERTDVRGGGRLRHPDREDARPRAPVPLVRRRGRDRSRRGVVAGHRKSAAQLGDQPGLIPRFVSARRPGPYTPRTNRCLRA